MKIIINTQQEHLNSLESTILIHSKDKPINIGTKLLIKTTVKYEYSHRTEIIKCIVEVKGVSLKIFPELYDRYDYNHFLIYGKILNILEIKVKNDDESELEVGRSINFKLKEIIEILD